MLADDMNVFDLTIKGLQDKLHELVVIIDKTKVMVFRNGGRAKESERWTYSGETLEITDIYNYLGLIITPRGRYDTTVELLVKKATLAKFKAMSNMAQFGKLCNENIRP